MKKWFLPIVFVWFGCSDHPAMVNIKVSLTDSNHSVQVAGFDKMIINDIGRDTSAGVWESLLPVYKMPADTDMKDFQKAQPGRYMIKDSLVVFTPDTPFQKGQTYFVRYYNYGAAKNGWQFAREKKGTGLQGHKDLLFSY